MPHATLVAPFFADNTLRYIRALTELPGVTATVVSQDGAERLPADLRGRVASVARVRDCLDGEHIADGCRLLARQHGKVDRLLGVLEQLQLPCAHARDACDIEGMRLSAARNFRDKARMKDVLRAANVPVARHKLVETDGDAWQFAFDVGLPIILKPVDGLGSKSTFRIRTEDDLRAGLKALKPSLERPAQAEEFVVGTEHTCETVTIHGRAVWRSGTRYYPTPLEVLENPWVQYCVLLPREEHDPTWTGFWPTNDAALAALGMETGLSHMEWFRRDDGSHVVGEVGARPPGVHIMPMMSLANDIDMTRAWVRLMVLDEFTPPTRRRAAGAAFFRGQGRGNKVVEVRGLREAQEEVGVHVVDRSLPRVGQARTSHYEGEGWAIVVADDTETVKHALLRLVQLVQVRYG
ncbi:MAG: hypothetical protein EXR79_14755 [Myxococcales bacterium]|nr:hypothetical protein [Myxococcales bacterium]